MSSISEKDTLNIMAGSVRASETMTFWAVLVEYINDYFSGQKHKFYMQKQGKQK